MSEKIERELSVGDIVKNTMPLLGNPMGALGVVVHDYKSGVQVIFENGEYDGFSRDEQKEMLEYIGHEKTCEDYRFEHVIKLINDFHDGRFSRALELPI